MIYFLVFENFPCKYGSKTINDQMMYNSTRGDEGITPESDEQPYDFRPIVKD